jgi:hypothetical protein
MTKKVKSEHLGTYITRYNDKGFDISIVVNEKLADNHEYFTKVGLGYLFEDVEPKSKKFKGVEPDANTEA